MAEQLIPLKVGLWLLGYGQVRNALPYALRRYNLTVTRRRRQDYFLASEVFAAMDRYNRRITQGDD